MLVHQPMTCSSCKSRFTGILQYSKFTCKKCGRETELCDSCKETGKCPNCGSNQLENASEQYPGMMF